MRNVFDPNTFNPEVIEDSIVLMAVMTPITENTPIAMPKSVRVERSLLALRASTAILKLSFKVFFK